MAEEARLRGLDPAGLSERAASRVRRGQGLALNLPADLLNMDPRVLDLLQQALDGSGLLADLGQQLGGGGGGGGAGGGDFEVEDVVPPEPPAAAVSQLTDMGFGAPLVRKAMLLSRHNVDLALEWLLQHGEEAGADAPPTQEQLRAVWGTRRRRRAVAPGAGAANGGGPAAAAAAAAAQPAASQAGQAPSAAAAQPAASPAAAAAAEPPPVSEAAVGLLVEMGFSVDAAQRALRRFGGNVDLAVAQLLAAQSAGGAADPAGAQQQQRGGGAAAGPSGAAPQQQEAAAAAAAGGGDRTMESPVRSGEGVDGDMQMAEAGSPPRGAAGGPAARAGVAAQQQQRLAGDNEEEMVDAEEGFGMGVSWVARKGWGLAVGAR